MTINGAENSVLTLAASGFSIWRLTFVSKRRLPLEFLPLPAPTSDAALAVDRHRLADMYPSSVVIVVNRSGAPVRPTPVIQGS